jgi:hypothetical protein
MLANVFFAKAQRQQQQVLSVRKRSGSNNTMLVSRFILA